MCHEAERWKLTLRRHWLEEFGDRCRAGLEMKNRRPAPWGGNLRLILCCRSETDGSSQGGHVGGLRPNGKLLGPVPIRTGFAIEPARRLLASVHEQTSATDSGDFTGKS